MPLVVQLQEADSTTGTGSVMTSQPEASESGAGEPAERGSRASSEEVGQMFCSLM